ncbi:12256_t:CDS:1, partial [Funneliformis caledonium]
ESLHQSRRRKRTRHSQGLILQERTRISIENDLNDEELSSKENITIFSSP